MPKSAVSSIPLTEFSLWQKAKEKRIPLSFDLEITARCNNNCRHCYINLPAGDKSAKKRELTNSEIKTIAKDAVSLCALWCLVTGGEPLLREDFCDIYLTLQKAGLLVSVFTNATLISEKHIEFFKKHPPRDIEVSVYGVTKATYEKVTRRHGSFNDFMRGINLLLQSGVKVRLKAMALRSNLHELPKIARFCRERTKDFYRFDPFLHLRYDRNTARNAEIRSERLLPHEIVALERKDPERFKILKKNCDKLIVPDFMHTICNHLFHCGAGNGTFAVSYDGLFRLCSSLYSPECVYDLRKGNLIHAWKKFAPEVRDMRSNKRDFLKNCRVCPLINLCMWCPGRAHLETGALDKRVDYFCEIAHCRAQALEKG